MSNATPSFARADNSAAVLTSLMVGDKVDGTAVASATKSIAGAGAKLDNQIHGTAVACIMLSMSIAEGGPASGAGPATGLLNAMPKGSRAKALAAWFAAYSNLRLRYDKKAKAWTGGVLDAKAKSYAKPDPDAAMAKPFWSVEEADVVPQAFLTGNLTLAVANLIKKATADNAKLDAKGKAALSQLEAAAKTLAPAE